MANEENNVLPEGWEGGTYLNTSITTYDDLAYRVKLKLGFPTVPINVTDEQISAFIDTAVEKYSKYAGFEKECFVFCGDKLNAKCGIKLDEAIDSCECLQCKDCEEVEVVSAIDIERTIIGSGVATLSAYTNTTTDSDILNNISTSRKGFVNIGYDINQPWNFDICNVDEAYIQPISSIEPELLSPCIDAWICVKNGQGEFYPPNWQSIEGGKCSPLSAWWGFDTSLSANSAFQDATHIIVKDVPNCTISGCNYLDVFNGRAGTFTVCNSALDTCGNIPAKIQFAKCYDFPKNLEEGFYNLDFNNGFKVGFCVDCIQGTNEIPISATFFETTSSEVLATSSICYSDNNDRGLGKSRKILGVYNIDANDNGVLGSGVGIVFDTNYLIAQSFGGANGSYGGFSKNGYDLVSLEALHHFLDVKQKVLAEKPCFTFDKFTQTLKITDNNGGGYECNPCGKCYAIGVYRERKIEDMLKEWWVQEYVEALTLIAQGYALTKFQGFQSLGGATINGTDSLSNGLARKAELEQYLLNDYGLTENGGSGIYIG